MTKDQGFVLTEKRQRSRAIAAFEGSIYATFAWMIASQLGLVALLPFLREVSYAEFFAAFVGGAIGLTRGLGLLRIWSGTLLAFWFLVGYTPLTSYLTTPLKVEQQPEKVDAVVVLQAGMQEDNDFGMHTLERTLHALELVQQGYAPRLILTDTTLDPTRGSHKVAASRLIKNLGVRCQLFSVEPVYNTHDEALLTAALAKRQGWRKILLVTSPTHSKRAFLTFSKTGLQAISSPCRESAFDFENLDGSEVEGRIRAFGQMVREVVGLRTYQARGWV